MVSPARRPPPPRPKPASGGPRIIIILAVVGVIVVIAGAVFLVGASGAANSAKKTACMNNLAQLWKLQNMYAVQHGGPKKEMPTYVGGGFWLQLETTKPPLVDASLREIFSCPVEGNPNPKGTTDYRGPSKPIIFPGWSDEDAVGADKIGGHPSGGNVLLRNGSIQDGEANAALWKKAGTTTTP